MAHTDDYCADTTHDAGWADGVREEREGTAEAHDLNDYDPAYVEGYRAGREYQRELQ